MPANNDLFELIKSLSKSEKRYFRMSASLNSRSRVNRYVHLFRMIDEQELYDEDAVRAAFTAQFGSEHFAEAKYYLYNAILRSLHTYAADRSVSARLSIALHQAEILYERKLYRQCIKQLERIRQQAVEHEQWYHAIEAAKLEIRLRKFRGIGEKEELEHLLEEIARGGDAWSDHLKRWMACSRVDLYESILGPPRDQEQLDRYWSVLKENDGDSSGDPLTPSAAFFHLRSLSICQHASRDFRGALATHLMILDLIESSPSSLGATPSTHVLALMHVCLYSIHARDAATFLKHYPRLMERTERSPESIQYSFHIHSLALLPHFHAAMGEFEQARDELAAVERALGNFGPWRGIGLDSTMGRLFLAIRFGLGEYDRCVDHVNELLALRSNGLAPHYYAHLRLIQLILHFEREDYDLLEHLLRSAHRYFATRQPHYAEERAILDFLRKALRSGTNKERTALLRALLAEIAPLRYDPFGLIFLESVDIPAWIESKLTGRSYAEITRDLFIAESAWVKEEAGIEARV